MTTFWQAESRFDWYAYAMDKGAVRAIAGRRDEYLLVCPQCGKLKLAINVKRRRWQCFTCGDGGRDGASLVARVEQLPWHEGLVLFGSCDGFVYAVDGKTGRLAWRFLAAPEEESCSEARRL